MNPAKDYPVRDRSGSRKAIIARKVPGGYTLSVYDQPVYQVGRAVMFDTKAAADQVPQFDPSLAKKLRAIAVVIPPEASPKKWKLWADVEFIAHRFGQFLFKSDFLFSYLGFEP